MKQAILAVIAGLLFPLTTAAAAEPGKITVELAVGLGWHLCEDSKTPPPLESAFRCPGLQPSLQNITVELLSQKTAQPGWLLYSGRYDDTVEFDGTKSRIELLVSYTKFDGEAHGFIDGRITSERPGKPVSPTYFRLSYEGGFDAMTSSLNFGAAVRYELSPKKVSAFAPIVAIARKQ
jgi:hypothetical protein